MNNRTQTVEQLQKHVDELLAVIPDDKPVDLQQLFFRYTLDTTTSLLFGRSTSSLTAGSTEGETSFAEAFNVAQDFLARRARLGDFCWLIGGRKFRDACKDVHRFVDSMIADALLARATRIEDKEEIRMDYIFLDALVEETQDTVALRSTCLNILLAGRDTTACCLSWTLWVIQASPSVVLFDLTDSPAAAY